MSGIEKQEVKIDIRCGTWYSEDGKLEGSWSRWCERIWFKRFRSLHGVIREHLQDCLDSGSVPDWMVKGRSVLIQRILAKER